MKMSNENLIVLYKEVEKVPDFKKIENNEDVFKELIGGELDFIPYEEVVIVARKNRENLKPNIYINTEFLRIGSSIRGTLLVLCKENDTFKSLSKEQAMKYREFLIRASFNYDNFNEKGRYIPKREKDITQLGNFTFIKQTDRTNDNETSITTKVPSQDCNSEEVLKMILAIQTVILKFIKNYIE